jgi:DNA-binding FadR family transcriptional regulator
VLEGEIAASEQLRVSRTAYREALRILAAKGLVESRPKLGTRVSESRAWHLLDPDVVSWIFSAQPDKRLLTALFELRAIVEPAAAALAAVRRNKEQLRTMRLALADMATESLAVESGRQADQQFHSALLEASGNPFLASLTSGIAAAVTWTTVFKQRRVPLVRNPLPDHHRVYEAVDRRDPAAARAAMTDLVRLALLDTTRARPASARRPRAPLRTRPAARSARYR